MAGAVARTGRSPGLRARTGRAGRFVFSGRAGCCFCGCARGGPATPFAGLLEPGGRLLSGRCLSRGLAGNDAPRRCPVAPRSAAGGCAAFWPAVGGGACTAFWVIGGRESRVTSCATCAVVATPPAAAVVTTSVVAAPFKSVAGTPSFAAMPAPTAHGARSARRGRGGRARSRERARRAELQRAGRHHRQDHSERGALAFHFGAEETAGLALGEVAAQHGAAQRTAAQHAQLALHFLAAHLAGLAALHQRRTRLEHERLHLVLIAAQDLGYLCVRVVVELGEHQRLALVRGQRGEVLQHRAQVRAAGDLVGQAARATAPRRRARRSGGGRAAMLRHWLRAIRYSQGRTCNSRSSSPHHRAICVGERLLHRVLGLVMRAEQWRQYERSGTVVALPQCGERILAAVPHLRDKLLVGGEPQALRRPRGLGAPTRGRAPRACARGPLREPGGLHAVIIDQQARC